MLTPNTPGTAAAGLLIAGAVAGLAAGTLRVGGGIVLVPALYLALSETAMAEGARLPVAVATGLAASLPTILSLLQNARQNRELDTNAARAGLFGATAAGGVGAGLACFAPQIAILAVLIAGALALAFGLFFAKDRPPHCGPANTLADGAIKAGFALATTFCGIGCGYPIGAYLSRSIERPKAAAAGLAIEAVVTVAAMAVMIGVGYWRSGLPTYSLGYVNLAAFAVAAPAMFLTATFVHGRSDPTRTKALGKIFALLILVGVTRMVWRWIEIAP